VPQLPHGITILRRFDVRCPERFPSSWGTPSDGPSDRPRTIDRVARLAREPPEEAQGSKASVRLGEVTAVPNSIDEVIARLGERRYICDRSLATTVFLALRLGKPLFIEGEAGVGKTEAAKVMADVLGARLIRLQCYEGIDLAHAVYEWNYPRQLLHIRLLDQSQDRERAEREIFSREFLLRRPLLDAIDNQDPVPPVLLIDEIDRSDEEFEAFLLELLSDFQVSIPELGTITARQPPFVVITSNRTREVHDALKRRCLYHWIDYPTLDKEVQIVRARAPEAAETLAREVATLVHGLRDLDLYKVPGVAETLDWARSLAALGATRIDPGLIDATLGAALKYQEDLERARQAIPDLVERAQAGA
jgi:MoxR-like ATPase